MSKLPIDEPQPKEPAPGKSMGKGMLYAAWLVALVMLTLFFGNLEEKQYNPNSELQSAVTDQGYEVSLKRNKWGHYVATGKINGTNVTFLVDTGATLVAIPYHLKDKLNLNAGISFPVATANGQSTAYATNIAQLQLGSISLANVRGGLSVGMEGEEVLLGMSALSGLELIQSGDTLVIRQF